MDKKCKYGRQIKSNKLWCNIYNTNCVYLNVIDECVYYEKQEKVIKNV